MYLYSNIDKLNKSINYNSKRATAMTSIFIEYM